uniref:Uncharacterized protein n=1 Tax=Rhizophora mucronata TaxID=61149 RepID=A0A2P2LVH1_RHIMU
MKLRHGKTKLYFLANWQASPQLANMGSEPRLQEIQTSKAPDHTAPFLRYTRKNVTSESIFYYFLFCLIVKKVERLSDTNLFTS